MKKWIVRKRVVLGHLFTVLLLLAARRDMPWQLLGFAVAGVGVAVRLWAAGCLYKDQVVCTTGPYAHLRNPLYLGSFLLFLGLTVASAQPLMGVAFVLFFPTIYWVTIRSEENYLLAHFPSEYKPFFDKVPRFLPRPLPAQGLAPSKPFSWEQVKGNKEYEGLGGFVVVALVMILITRLAPASVLGAAIARFTGG